ncbi:MAG TPA: hypothetical protein VE891_05255 [Allosphingosinicella sp.]|nr:hypothetical protein [Allosphingosinicella sp.]
MGSKRKSPGRRPIIDSAAKVAMLAAIREGRRLDAVAASYGVTLQAFYSARRRDAVFAAAWADAHSLSAEAERRGAGSGNEEAGDEVQVASNNRRLLQRRRMRHVRFDERRKGIFLAHFARSCDLIAAATAAGVCERTVYNHVRRDPEFAEAFQAALEEGYRRLEAEALRARLGAQQRLRSAMEAAEAAGELLPVAEEGVEFDRAMTMLARWDRRDGRLGWREVRHGRRRHYTFEEAIVILDKKLDAFGLRHRLGPPGKGG